jgi:nitrous oxide reductase accessory protein NosL
MKLLVTIFCVALVAGCAQSPRTCAVCNRDECKGMAFRVTLENGKTVETCCPRCGLHYLETNHLKARTIEATDFATGNWVDATRAVYVSDSNVHPCATLETRRDPQGCCMTKTYDRCLPSLVAFAGKVQAAAFQKDHGGQLVGLETISAK